MGKIYKVEIIRDGWGKTLPEVFFPPRIRGENHPIEFRLSDAARVKVGSFNGTWREFSKGYYSRYFQCHIESEFSRSYAYLYLHDDKRPLEVEVETEVWECNPGEIIQHIEDLTDKVSRRNRQIEDLRDQLATAKQR